MNNARFNDAKKTSKADESDEQRKAHHNDRRL